MMDYERENFKEIYLKYHKLIKKIAYDHIHDYNVAQDICQETFIRLYDFEGYMPEEKIKSWLIVVAANIAKDMLKKGGKYREVVGLPESEELVRMMPVSNEVDDYLKRMGERELFETALSRLREKNPVWYDLVVLVKCMNVPRKKVAEEYGIALTTVDGYLKRAKNWLVANFGDEYRDL